MDNEKFQELMMDQLKTLIKSVDTLAANHAVMQQDVTSLKQDLTDLKQSQTRMEQDITDLKQSQTRMEQDLTNKVTALFDAREAQKDVNTEMFATLNRIEAKLDVLQMETAHLKRIK